MLLKIDGIHFIYAGLRVSEVCNNSYGKAIRPHTHQETHPLPYSGEGNFLQAML